jgi:DNA repair exonuclease SbcCD ATPase subunit
MLLRFSIRGFRGIVEFEAEPNGKSLTLKGKNGAGKSSAVDALYWGLGGRLDGTVINNGADAAETRVEFGEYVVTRKQKREGAPSLVVKPANGGKALPSPTALLSGFIGAIERQTFSTKPAKEQAAILRRLAPEIDTSSLDAEYERIYAERRDAATLTAQANGVVIIDAPVSVPDDIDIVAIAAKKTGIEKKRLENDQLRQNYQNAERAARTAAERRAECILALERAQEQMENADRDQAKADGALTIAKNAAANLIDPDTSAIDAEIAQAKEENARLARERQNMREAAQARTNKTLLEKIAAAKQKLADDLSARLDRINDTKRRQLANVKLPIDGLSIKGEAVTLDQGTGPVELSALNTAARMRLDILVAAALGHRLIAVRDASLIDDMAPINEFAKEHGVQLVCEVVAKGEPLQAEIVDVA